MMGVACSLVALSACGAQPTSSGAADADTTGSTKSGDTATQVVKVSQAVIGSNIERGASDVDLTRKIRLNVESGTLAEVSVTSPEGANIKGKMSADKTSWVSKGPLTADTRYRVSSTAVDPDGLQKGYQARFRTRALTLDEQTYPSFVPTDGQTVGVGMPVIVKFDVAVQDKAAIQKHVQVVSQPAQVGAFHWISSQEVHWRPKNWKPGTKVTVKADIGGVPAGGGIYGQKDRQTSFTVGRSMVSKVDMNTHQMRVFENGKQIRTIPITTGEQPKFTTRSGTKVIDQQFRHKRMNSETIGINPDSADGYDLDDVEYAMRVTYSGEFVHAAPWSVGSQGSANVSHGCTGMSTANAAWLYNRTNIGDVVEYTGTSKPMTLTNGFGDWNESFATYKSGSAVS